MAEAALFGFGVGAGVGHALAVELEPCETAVDVGLVGVGGKGRLQGFEGGKVLGVGCVA